jgi:hypothetical protein
VLITQSKQLVGLLERREELLREQTQVQGFEARQTLIAEIVSGLKPWVDTLKLFCRRRISKVDLSKKVATALNLVNEIDENFQSQPDWIISTTGFNFQVFQTTLLNLRTDLETSLIQCWQRYTDERTPKINKDLLNVLRQIGAQDQAVKRIQSLSGQIDRYRNTVPQTDEELEMFEDVVEQLKKAWEGLNLKNVPTAALELLLKAVTAGGAPLSLLTREVSDWLVQNKLDGAFRIHSIDRLTRR